MAISNGFSTFMNTEKESKRWHNGIYQGIKSGIIRHNPDKLRDDLRVVDKPFKEWYADDDHYFDVPYLVMYLLTSSVEIVAAASLIQFAIGL